MLSIVYLAQLYRHSKKRSPVCNSMGLSFLVGGIMKDKFYGRLVGFLLVGIAVGFVVNPLISITFAILIHAVVLDTNDE